jgi:trehalose/maltose hydrolase-like predicted phosphorylase
MSGRANSMRERLEECFGPADADDGWRIVDRRFAAAHRGAMEFVDACAVDLLDAHANTCDGIHVASGGGTWLVVVAGFGGLRDTDASDQWREPRPSE